jgi:hypothetical protein
MSSPASFSEASATALQRESYVTRWQQNDSLTPPRNRFEKLPSYAEFVTASQSCLTLHDYDDVSSAIRF